VVDDPTLLREIAENCYCRGDVGASWIGPFVPETNNTTFVFRGVTAKALAGWARQHWMIYDSFIDEFCTRNRHVLDVGCGSGNTTSLLSVVFPHNKIMGIDTDKKAIKFCEKFNPAHNVEYVSDDIMSLKNETRFGYVFACEILEHIPHHRQFSFVARCLELLDDDGLLFMSTPNAIQEEPSGHHIGLLNTGRFPDFYSKYRNNICSFSFIDNRRLLTCNKGVEAVYYEEPQRYDAPDKNRSHFRFAFTR
jgi:2-polyprenyl-3-methyl-5-hydroxy-6-metoxy-1,4-benzoquinol methylase